MKSNRIERMRVGTPPVMQLTALETALDVWDGITMETVRAASLHLSELFIREVEARCPALTLASPRDGAQRGSQVSRRDRRLSRAQHHAVWVHAALS